MFNIASNTKLFTALTLGLALHDSVSPARDWNTKVRDILPHWVPQDPVLRSYGSIKDLLSHRTGMPRHDLAYHDGQKLESAVSWAECHTSWVADTHHNIGRCIMSPILMHQPNFEMCKGLFAQLTSFLSH